MEVKTVVKIQILGSGCAKCQQLARNAEAAATALGIGYELEHVTKPDEISKFGVWLTPALVVDGVVKSAGQVPDVETIRKMLES